MSSQLQPVETGLSRAQVILRRIIQYALLFVLVLIAASGLSGLLERLFNSGAVLAATDVAGLAGGLAFTLIGGPLALLLWWFLWRRLDEAERTAVGWGLYLAGTYLVSLIIATTSLLGLAASLIGEPRGPWASPLANGLVWAVVWVWHRWMWKHPDKGAAHLEDIRCTIGTVFGLLVGTIAAIIALSGIFDVAIRGGSILAGAADPWWHSVLRSLVWAAGGGVVWWWHWIHEGGRRLRTGLVDVSMVAVGIFAAGITALGGSAVALFVLLRLAFDGTDPMGELLEPLAPALAAALIGATVWRYHRAVSVQRSSETRRASLLVTSAVALAASASGIGVIVSSLLAAAVSPLAGGAERTLLLGGISSLVVGGTVWWLAWRPAKQPHSADAIPHGRRIYLIAFFGVSAVVALIALLVIAYRIFEFLLGEVSGGSAIDRVRGPLGLLVAAGLVAGYHFALWRRDRALLAAAGPARRRSIDHVTLVAGSGSEAIAQGIAEVTGGAKVTVWLRADDGAAAPPEPVASPASEESAGQLAKALEGITARHVLVVLGPGTRVDVIPVDTRGH
ncbi:DUF5671 domain-containing protein [Arthrobacter sp. B6]|uniref:DUF5671 domain-containing protein n=1 Tax=Arthrobacter sp. B6 TaxID=1570137 RepID=UPI00082E4499|nr:DUF5671 domain-containing protein [Arthrobacter sp. B6]